MSAFRIGEAAAVLGLSVDTVRRIADAGELPTTRTRGGHRVVDGRALAAYASARSASPTPRTGSARNRFAGIVTRVVRDRVAAQVEIRSGPHRIVALLTREAADELALEPGVPATAVVKATNVTVEVVDAPERPSARRGAARARGGAGARRVRARRRT